MRSVAGQVLVRPGNGSGSLRVEARDLQSDRVLGHAAIPPDGLFRIPVESEVDDAATVELSLFDEAGETLAARETPLGRAAGEGIVFELESAAISARDAVAAAAPASFDGALAAIEQAVATKLPPPLRESGRERVDRLRSILAGVAALAEQAQGALEGDSAAAARVRYALCALTPAVDADELTQPAGDIPASRAAREQPTAGTVENGASSGETRLALTITLAAVWAARDPLEAQQMLDAAGLVLSGLTDLALYDGAAHAALSDLGDVEPLMTLMSSPGPGGLLGPGSPFGPAPPFGPGSPPGPGLPPHPDGPPRRKPTPDLVPKELWSRLGLRTPIEAVDWAQCAQLAAVAAAQIQPQAPHYAIDDVTGALAPEPHGGHACPGAQIRLTGHDFGTSGMVLFPTSAGPDATYPVAADSWSDTEILVTVPTWAAPGTLGLRIIERELEICFSPYYVYRLGTGALFDGGVPAVFWIAINGAQADAVAAPGSDAVVTWLASTGEGTSVALSFTDGVSDFPVETGLPGGPGTAMLHMPAVTEPTTFTVRVTASSNYGCGSRKRDATVTVTVLPSLAIEGVEVVQGIQSFWRPGAAWNDTPTVEDKDTYVRVYVSSNRGGFYGDRFDHVTGRIVFYDKWLMPINTGASAPFLDAGPRAGIRRDQANDTLNFRIPAGWCHGGAAFYVQVFASDESGAFHMAEQKVTWQWQPKKPYRVRYVRLRDGSPGGTGNETTAAQAADMAYRMFDLLPSPATDIGPAWLSEWNDSAVWPQDRPTLVNHLDDQHNCSPWEQLWPWSDPCPSPDHAVWVGFYPSLGWGATSTESHNTCVTGLNKRSAAHELGHALCLRHVNVRCKTIWPAPSTDCNGSTGFDDLPGGGLLPDVPFDPETRAPMTGQVWDVMTYACQKWISHDNWVRLMGMDT